MEIYRARTKHRENLALAKEWFQDKTSLDPRNYRVLITEIKNQLMAGKEPDSEKINRRLKKLE